MWRSRHKESGRGLAPVLAMIFVIGSCYRGPPAPTISRVAPNPVSSLEATTITVHGTDFFAAIERIDLDAPEQSAIDATFEIRLIGEETSLLLTDVERADASRISGLVPAGVKPGSYDVELVAPDGRSALSLGALDVVVPDEVATGGNCTTPDDCVEDPCVLVPLCVRGQCIYDNPPSFEIVDGCDGIDNDCDGFVDESCTPPVAELAVTPRSGDETTVFVLDARGSFDSEQPTGSLEARWDWEGDGTWDTDWSATKRESRVYPAPGFFVPTVQVRDDAGLTGHAALSIQTSSASTTLTVTTTTDESDPETFDGPRLGEGLSLREAIALANTEPGKNTISFAAPGTYTLGADMPAFTDGAGTDLVGGEGVVLDGGLGGNDNAIQISTSNVHILALVFRNFMPTTGDGAAVQFLEGANDSALRDCAFTDNLRAVFVEGDFNTIGPGNELGRSTNSPIRIRGTDNAVVGNLIHDGDDDAIVLLAGADRTLIARNVITGMLADGIVLSNNSPGVQDVQVSDNTIVDMRSGIRSTGTRSQRLVVLNNIFSSATLFGLELTDANFSGGTLDRNLYFNNVSDCYACRLGPFAVLDDPRLLNPDAGDYRLGRGSPAIDSGTTTGVDKNGLEPGDFSGPGPDIGAIESGY